MHKWISEEIWN